MPESIVVRARSFPAWGFGFKGSNLKNSQKQPAPPACFLPDSGELLQSIQFPALNSQILIPQKATLLLWFWVIASKSGNAAR
jgi:hypothetical protein